MQLLNIQALDKLTSISDEQIEKYSVQILSVLIGQLRHENNLCNLHKAKDEKFPWEEGEEYLPPEQIAQIEELKEKLRTERDKNYHGH